MLIRFNFLAYLLLALSLSGCTTKENENQDTSKPNILFIFTDDQTYSSINALGYTEVKTPNLDRLVTGGTTFTHAYNMGAWQPAVCLASRAMIISGRSVWRASQFRHQWQAGDSTALEQTWPKLMEAGGYQTFMSGKWHVDAPATTVFNNTRNVRGGMPKDAWNFNEMVRRFAEEVGPGTVKAEDIMPVGYNRPIEGKQDEWSPSDPKFGGFWEGGKHWSEVVKDDALHFIEQAGQSASPFFMYLAFNAPHDPRQAPASYHDQYPLEKLSVPASFQGSYPQKELIGNGQDLRDEALAPYPRTPYAIKKHLQEYYAMITHIDDQVGEILAALTASGQAENTYIIFTADHGLAVGRHGLIGKQNMYDHSIRVPLMISGPDIPANQKLSQDVYLQDVMATALELGKIPAPAYLEFNSLLPLVHAERQESYYPAVYGAYVNYQRMIRKDGFKLMIYPQAEQVKLFDLTTDPEEIHNLAAEPNQQARIAEMYADLRDLQKSYADTLNLQPLMNKFLAKY